MRVKRKAAAPAVMATSPATSRGLGGPGGDEPEGAGSAAALPCASSGGPAGPPSGGTPRGDVQADVVNLHRVAHPVGDGVDIGLPQLLRQLLEMVTEADRADVVARLAGGHRPGL